MFASVLLKEVQLCWGFARRDLGIGALPVPLFTLASLLYKNAPIKEMVRPMAIAFIYGIFYLYSFVVANQIAGVEEDKINKPDRPITSGATSLKAATIRYYILSALYLAYSYVFGLEKYTLLWIVTTYAHNFLGFATFGPTKDMCMGLGGIAQLMAAWTIGGADSKMGWKWTKTITIIMSWAIPIQDLRDVPGDLEAGRRTTPMILGDMPARLHITAGIFVAQYQLIKECILVARDDAVGCVTSAVIALMGLIVVAHLFADRSLHGDQISYRLYTVVYVAQLAAACVALKAH